MGGIVRIIPYGEEKEKEQDGNHQDVNSNAYMQRMTK
jgi:hypothetical protein